MTNKPTLSITNPFLRCKCSVPNYCAFPHGPQVYPPVPRMTDSEFIAFILSIRQHISPSGRMDNDPIFRDGVQIA